jgi:hypothetical protein
VSASPNGDRLVAPRVLARTTIVTRNVVALPDGYAIEEAEDPTNVAEIDPERSALGDAQQRFWAEFLHHLKLDDPEQQKPRAARMGYITSWRRRVAWRQRRRAGTDAWFSALDRLYRLSSNSAHL